MKAVLEFDLWEDKEALELAIAGPALHTVIRDLDEKLRSFVKHDQQISDEVRDVYDNLRTWLAQEMQDENLSQL